MFKKFYCGLLILASLSSCGFKDDEEVLGEKKSEVRVARNEEMAPDGDYDGDLVLNKEELERGTNPKIANLPKLRTKFLQSYKIKIEFTELKTEGKGSVEISSHKGPDDVGFSYRVGKLLIREDAKKNAAKYGRFSSHSYAEIEPQRLSWVKYPELSNNRRIENIRQYSKYFNEENFKIENISIVLKNEARLVENEGFNEVKDLGLNFYFHNYETENKELLKSELVKRNFLAGINETFEVLIENVPSSLISENFLKRGEFIFSEVQDFEIPSLEVKRSQILSSISEKCVPVILNTPDKLTRTWVGVNGKTARFHEILNIAYGNKAKIVNDEIDSIYQFKSNLPDYTYLSEVAKLDKKGKWFIFTNKLPTDYLNHKYSKDDVITLSYIRGSDLAKQIKSKSALLKKNLSSSKSSQYQLVSEVFRDSKTLIKLIPHKKWGEIREVRREEAHQRGGICGRNRVCSEFHCKWEISTFSKYEKRYGFKKALDEEMARIRFLIGPYEFSGTDLIEKESLHISEKNGELLLEISNISNLVDLTEEESVPLAIGVISNWKTSFNGVKLTLANGAGGNTCMGLSTSMAGHNKIPLSVESLLFSRWEHLVNWNVIKRGEEKEYGEDFSFSLISLTSNYFN